MRENMQRGGLFNDSKDSSYLPNARFRIFDGPVPNQDNTLRNAQLSVHEGRVLKNPILDRQEVLLRLSLNLNLLGAVAIRHSDVTGDENNYYVLQEPHTKEAYVLDQYSADDLRHGRPMSSAMDMIPRGGEVQLVPDPNTTLPGRQRPQLQPPDFTIAVEQSSGLVVCRGPQLQLHGNPMYNVSLLYRTDR